MAREGREGRETKNTGSLIKEDVNHCVKDIKTIYRNLESGQLDARLRGLLVRDKLDDCLESHPDGTLESKDANRA